MTPKTTDQIIAVHSEQLAQQQRTFNLHCEKQNHNLERIWEEMEGMRKDMEGMRKDFRDEVADIRNDLARRLPLWATFLVTALFSAVVGLLVASRG